MNEIAASTSKGKTLPSTDTSIPNEYVRAWVAEMVALCQPDRVRVLTGSGEEKQELLRQAVDQGVLIKLNEQKLPGCYLHRSHPNDVARTEHNTFICTPIEQQAGPTNNWMEAKQAYGTLRKLFNGAMRGRTMYVIPFV